MDAPVVVRHAIIAAMLAAGGAVVAGAASPRAGNMIGIGRTMRGNMLVEYEFVVVRERGERFVYLAHPSGQPSAEFVSITATPNEVVFENAQHDFPQRVGYQRQGADLAAWIEGSKDGQTRRIDFHYRRAACPAD
jgi:Domain of unknown function (DUF6265)